MKSPLLNFRIITNKGVKQRYDNMFYTEAGVPIRNPEAYAATGAPMYERGSDRNINAPTTIYVAELDYLQDSAISSRSALYVSKSLTCVAA